MLRETGYQVRFVEYVPEGPVNMGGNDPADKAIHLNMAASFDWCVLSILPSRLPANEIVHEGPTPRFARFRLLLGVESLSPSLAGRASFLVPHSLFPANANGAG